jgi:catechol 2,3-dioxygenase-like lactoylglutathione lyase family enzyme
MRGFFTLTAGVLIGVATSGAIAQSRQPAVRLNHVAIAVADINKALAWYRDTMGFQEVIRNVSPQGDLRSAYIQVSRDTFLEIQQAGPQQAPGLNHWGLEVADLPGSVATFRQRGATVSDPSTTPSAFSGGMLANVTDPNSGGRIELSYQPAEGKLRKASEAWKE